VKWLLNLSRGSIGVVMKRRIDQVLTGVAKGDAITNMAFSIRDELREFVDSDIYVEFVLSKELEDEVYYLQDQKPDLLVDLTLFHASYGRPQVTQHILSRNEKLAIAYHNISPTEIYVKDNAEFAVGLEWGRYELSLLRDRVKLSFADSQFNLKDLEQYGYTDVHLAPVGLTPRRLTSLPYDSRLIERLNRTFPDGFVVGVGQVLPHKRVEQLIETIHLVNSVHDKNFGLVLVGAARQEKYLDAINQHKKSLPFVNVELLGSVKDQELATVYRMAKCYFGMSDHEGLCIPPLEAMSFGLPVVIKGTGAIPETLKNAAVVLPANASVTLASEAIVEVIDNANLRAVLASRGYELIQNIELNEGTQRSVQKMLELIA
jgi:glycosyltransferase involved in cell wall biosynthesis